MDKKNKKLIQALVDRLLKLKASDVSYETLELLALFVIYVVDNEYYKTSPAYGYTEKLRTEVQKLSQERDSIKELLAPVLKCINSNTTILEETIDGFASHYGEYGNQGLDNINYLISLFEDFKGPFIKDLITPGAILELCNNISGLGRNERVLDLFARKGEWSDLLSQETSIRYESLSDFCFDPLHYVISSLKSKMCYRHGRHTSLHSNYELGDIKQNHYDVVFANPPFSSIPIETSGAPKAKLHSQFLYQALKACKQNGKVICIMPESFLSRGDRFDYELREKLVKDGLLKSVIRLPNSSFRPYTTVHTAILIIEKAASSSDVVFINLTKHSKGILEHDTQSITALVQGKAIETKVAHSITDLSKIEGSKFDLRPSIYIKKCVDEITESPDELKQKINQKEQELEVVRSKIARLIESMEIAS